MNKALRERIDEWNRIKYGDSKSNRIVICTLKPKKHKLNTNKNG
jgi:hypothetical protein